MSITLNGTAWTTWEDVREKLLSTIEYKRRREQILTYSPPSSAGGEYVNNNLRFESPSASRHGYMEMYKENGKHFLKLNMQIRFK